VTAGHFLIEEKTGACAKRIWVSPARNGKKYPYGTVQAKWWDVTAEWRKNIARPSVGRPNDYGMITLEKDVNTLKYKGTQLCFWGDNQTGTRLERLAPDQIDGQTVDVTGYPGDKTAGTMWTAVGGLSGLVPSLGIRTQDRLMLHTIDTDEGQSGGPVCLKKNGDLYLVGMHVAPQQYIKDGRPAKPTHNVAVRVTRELIRQIQTWLQTGKPAKMC